MYPELTKLADDNGMSSEDLLYLLQEGMTIVLQDLSSESAMTVMGLLHEGGTSDFFAPDVDESRRWYKAAAESGSAEAMYLLAVLEDEDGEQVLDNDERKQWLTEAADRFYEPAARRLREIEAEENDWRGLGAALDEDIEEEKHALRAQVAEGRLHARAELANYLLTQGEEIEARDLLEPALGQDAKANLLWATKIEPSTETGILLLRQALGLAEDEETQCQVRVELALKLIRQGDADQEAIEYLTEVGRITGTEPEGTKVQQLMRRSQLKSLADRANFLLARCYDQGRQRDAVHARKLYLKHNGQTSLFRAAMMTLRGNGCPADREEAENLLQRAIHKKSSWALVARNVGWGNEESWWQAVEKAYLIPDSKASAKTSLYALGDTDIELLLADNPYWHEATSDPHQTAPIEDLRGLLTGTGKGFLSKLKRARGLLDGKAGHFETEEALALLREVYQQYQAMDRPSGEKHFSASFLRRLRAEIVEPLHEAERKQATEAAKRAQLSFLSHTLSNASAGAQDTIRRAARLLGTVQADKPETLRRAMERLSGQIASLALIETLVASFKLYASDPDRVRESWDNEQSGEIAFVRVLALALRQVLTRLFTLPGHALDLRRLLPENGEALAQEFVADIMVLDLESDAEAERLIAWVRSRLPFLELRVEDDASLRFAQGGARFVVVFAVLAEILTNAVKYASAAPITLNCVLAERRMQILCRNRVQTRQLKALDTGGTGIAFLREICHVVGADIQDTVVEDGVFQVSFNAKA